MTSYPEVRLAGGTPDPGRASSYPMVAVSIPLSRMDAISIAVLRTPLTTDFIEKDPVGPGAEDNVPMVMRTVHFNDRP